MAYSSSVPRRIKGLTLLELLVALALAGTLAGSAALYAPELVAGWKLGVAARQVAVDLRQTRMMAIHAGRNHRLHFTVGSAQYTIERQETGGYVHRPRQIKLPEGVRVTACTAAGSSITFQPRGNAATFGTITLTHQSGRQRRVVVDLVGRVRIS